MSARDLVGDEDDFLFLAQAETVVPHDRDDVWTVIEADRHDALLRVLSERYAGRVVLEEHDDGYRCRTSSKAPLRRRRSYESVVWLDRPDRSVEVQFGRRTDLRYELTYTAVEGGTAITCAQSFRARSSSFESGPAIAQLQQRADEIVQRRIKGIRMLLG